MKNEIAKRKIRDFRNFKLFKAGKKFFEVWIISLIVTWIFLLVFSLKTGVFYDIPVELRFGLTRTYPDGGYGFIQDPFFSIFQIFLIFFAFSIYKVSNLVPEMVCKFVDLANKQSQELKKYVVIPPDLNNIVNQFQEKIGAKWHWYAALGFGIFIMLVQITIQINRIENMNLIYWWDWRISKPMFIIRLFMIGLDFFFGLIIAIRIVYTFEFNIKFLSVVQFTPQPLHPDGAGGLSIIGKTGMAFTIPLTIVGILIATSFLLHEEKMYSFINISSILILTVFAFFVFFYPLYTAHKAMKKSKKELLDSISKEINNALIQIEIMLKDSSNKHMNIYNRLYNLKYYYEIVNNMPVWPYDIKTLSSFITTFLIPLGMAILPNLINK
ncbi:MAG: hypothetical protein FIB08_12980 [Candidatus Methanoperedens sp.]|nr:hypothetical protein [Candidatus Methanoperedens sp.]